MRSAAPTHALAAACLTLGASSGTATPSAGAITVLVDNARDGGMVKVDACPADHFMKTCPYSGTAPARRGTVTVVIPNVPPGRYALQGLDDANGNGQLDRGAFGIPKEGVGFSRITSRVFRPPAFSAVAFDHGAADQTVTLHLNYYWM